MILIGLFLLGAAAPLISIPAQCELTNVFKSLSSDGKTNNLNISLCLKIYTLLGQIIGPLACGILKEILDFDLICVFIFIMNVGFLVYFYLNHQPMNNEIFPEQVMIPVLNASEKTEDPEMNNIKDFLNDKKRALIDKKKMSRKKFHTTKCNLVQITDNQPNLNEHVKKNVKMLKQIRRLSYMT